MSNLAEFLDSPWKKAHNAYDASAFNMRPAPEFATGEVLLSSTYRVVGYPSLSEGRVPANGRELDRKARKAHSPPPSAASVSSDTWKTILFGALQSPRRPSQASKRSLQLSPLVPETALYSGSARLSANSWPAGDVVRRMIEFGSPSQATADATWERLQVALQVGSGDDIWARWLTGELRARGTATEMWEPTTLEHDCKWPAAERSLIGLPARQFVTDVNALVKARQSMTRRQWTSLLESVLRLGSVGHVLWYCQINEAIWLSLRDSIKGVVPSSTSALISAVDKRIEPRLVYGSPAKPVFLELASRFLNARLSINHLLYSLAELGIEINSLQSMADIFELNSVVAANRTSIIESGFFERQETLQDEQSKILACEKGIGNNINEFCQYTLGQRESAEPILRGYDQGYLLRKAGEHKSARWIVAAGPVALLAFAHCCLAEAAGPRSVKRFCEHVARYGIYIDPDEFSTGALGRDLRMLNLVFDSPDAESGMLLVPPFANLNVS